MDDIVAGKFTIPGGEIDLSFARSSGPGGQNVNKVNSKVVLKWQTSSSVWDTDPAARARFSSKFANRINKEGFLVLHCQETRNQIDNIDICLDKLKAMILEIEPTPIPRKKIKETLTARQRRREEKVISHRRKQQRLKNRRPIDD